ncbi:unnamed protein product [Amoebophrya sp. A25]|nr:unnamed protein product [Amoebophrya sp. A25]|eukprot:GSA25T00011158001.1
MLKRLFEIRHSSWLFSSRACLPYIIKEQPRTPRLVCR